MAIDEDSFKPTANLDGSLTPDAPSEIQPRKVKVRHARKVEGVFETGLDVVEQEFDLEQQGTLE